MKMKERNAQLKSALGGLATKERVIEVNTIPKEDTVNRQGHAAYSINDKLRLVSMLNTLKIEPQFYRSENETMRDLRDLIEKIAVDDPYFVCQAIVWSRCIGEGMRTINHLAAAIVAPFIAGKDYAKRFYGLFDKKMKRGGCIFRPDDMTEIKDAYCTLTKSPMSNAMKKGFASAIEKMDTYLIGKYSKSVIDIANLAHPKSALSVSEITVDGKKMKTLDALMKGITITADTWESAQSEAGQEVAKAVRAGKLSKAEAEKVLAEAKADNWESLLKDGRLGMLAALRNIRNIMQNPRKETIDMWIKLITDEKKIRQALILPVYFDVAHDVIKDEFSNMDYANLVMQALIDGYTKSIPNLGSIFTGKTCIIVDCSGSMGSGVFYNTRPDYKQSRSWYETRHRQCSYKAGLIAATIAKSCNADIVKFGTSASYFTYNKNENVFSLADKIGTDEFGGTNPAAAFNLITRDKKKYDRIVFISDNEVNGRLTSSAYKTYVHDVCSPYVYGIDLASYGTTPLKNDGKVFYMFGYGPTLYDTISANEFNASSVIDEITKVVI